jgi:hypothetical protein
MSRIAVRFGFDAIVIAGVVAGIILVVFELLASGFLRGSEAAAVPLRMFAATALGSQALDPAYPLTTAVMTGAAIVLVLSIAFAVVFVAIMGLTERITGTRTAANIQYLPLAGAVYGAVVWVVSFYVVAPLAGWTWLTTQTNPFVQLVAFTVFFGCPVGWILGQSRAWFIR